MYNQEQVEFPQEVSTFHFNVVNLDGFLIRIMLLKVPSHPFNPFIYISLTLLNGFFHMWNVAVAECLFPL